MPGLRERVIAIICEEWPKGEMALSPVPIRERLQSACKSVSEAEVRLELQHLAEDDDIKVSLDPGGATGPNVGGVREGLCP